MRCQPAVIQVKRPPDFVLPDSRARLTAMETPVMLVAHAPPELRAFISEFLDWIAVCGARDEEVVAMFRVLATLDSQTSLDWLLGLLA